MRLMRLGEPGRERPHVVVDDVPGAHGSTPGGLATDAQPADVLVVDVSDVVGDFSGASLDPIALPRLERVVSAREPVSLARLGLRVGPPVARPEKIICIGLNYHGHAIETGQQPPVEPIVFFKAPNTLIGPTDPVRIPRGSVKTDWEVELGVVIGRQCRYLESVQQGLDAVAGYLVCNDVSEREFQLERSGQWVKGKSCETFNPAGPWLVTADEVGDPGDLDLWLSVNGVRRQQGNTSDMVFGVGEIVVYLSQFMVLEPGDIINTGTPAGVALGMAEPQYLRAGDVVELGVSGLGTQRQVFVGADD